MRPRHEQHGSRRVVQTIHHELCDRKRHSCRLPLPFTPVLHVFASHVSCRLYKRVVAIEHMLRYRLGRDPPGAAYQEHVSEIHQCYCFGLKIFTLWNDADRFSRRVAAVIRAYPRRQGNLDVNADGATGIDWQSIKEDLELCQLVAEKAKKARRNKGTGKWFWVRLATCLSSCRVTTVLSL